MGATYKSVWCAGPSIEFVNKIEPTKVIVERIINEYSEALNRLESLKDA
jgi:nitronate monooxygenase